MGSGVKGFSTPLTSQKLAGREEKWRNKVKSGSFEIFSTKNGEKSAS